MLSSLFRCIAGVIILFASSFAAFAEYGCQDGFVPVNQGQQSVCVADYNLPYWSQRRGETTRPVVRWEDRWGAIATQVGGSKVGTAENEVDEKSAIQSALAGCGPGCDIRISYRNQCVALVWGESKNSVAAEASIDLAARSATRTCIAKGQSKCEVVYKFCSRAVKG